MFQECRPQSSSMGQEVAGGLCELTWPARSRVRLGSHLAADHGPPPIRCHRWTGSRPPTCRFLVRFRLIRGQLVVRKPVARVRGPRDVDTLIRSITDRHLSNRCHSLVQNRPAGFSSHPRVRPRFLLPRPSCEPSYSPLELVQVQVVRRIRGRSSGLPVPSEPPGSAVILSSRFQSSSALA